MSRIRIFLCAVPALLLAAGCTTVGPDYEPPAPQVPAAWSAAEDSGLTAQPAELEAWWTRLQDPVLDSLIERAARQGLDLREALARVREARALRGVAAADRYPTVDALLSYRHSDESKNTPFGQFVPEQDLYSAGFDASWELDLWGRVRRSVEAADADLAARVEDARATAVMLAAETARNYIELRGFQRRLAIAQEQIGLQEQTRDLVQARLEAGLVGERDLAQALTNLERTRAGVPALEIGLHAAQNRLAVLLGQPPGSLAAELDAVQPIPVPPLQVAVGVPADLLRRRADVRSAERQLAAETARIGVAEADLYPRMTLLGDLGLQAEDLGDLPEADSSTFHIGPSLRWNLFDRERVHGRVDAQDERREQALVRWERTVLTALEEAENAMTSFVREQLRRRSLLAAAEQARTAVELARSQYTEGLTDFQAVLDSERELADLEDLVAQSDAAIATSAVALYKALGGGWEQMDGTLAEAAAAGAQ